MTRDKPKLILASASPRRLALLAQIGITPYGVEPADIDESVLKGELPRPHALRIACEKAQKVHARLPKRDSCVTLAADTVVACGRRILPKAEDDATVTKCLDLLSGRRHSVITAISVIDASAKLHTRTIETKVAFRKLGPDEIARYAKTGEGLGKAGGYAVQGYAAVFVRLISGSYTNVVGLPLTETFHMLRACDVV